MMVNDDTIKLLRECSAGVKMAITSIDDILDKVKDDKLKNILIDNKNGHTTLDENIHKLLLSYNDTDKDPNPMARAMSWVKINVKMLMDHNDHEVATVISDGCQMGIDSLNKYLEQYKAADQESKSITKKIISLEEQLMKSLEKYK